VVVKRPVYLADCIEAEFKSPRTRTATIELGRGERVYLEQENEDGSVEFRAEFPDAAVLTYPTSLPLMERTGYYSVVLVGNLLGAGLFAGPGLTNAEACASRDHAVKLHGASNVAIEADYRPLK
jgi:hypothetical protein